MFLGLKILILFPIFFFCFGQDCTKPIGLNSVLYVTPSGTGSNCSISHPCILSTAINIINGISDPRRIIWLSQGIHSLISVSFSNTNG